MSVTVLHALVGVLMFFIALVIGSVFLRLACWFCRIEVPWFGQAAWIIFAEIVACALVCTLSTRLIHMLGAGASAADLRLLRIFMILVPLPLSLVVSAYVYSYMIPTSFEKAVLIKMVQNLIYLLVALLILTQVFPDFTHVLAQKKAGILTDTASARRFLDQMDQKLQTMTGVTREKPQGNVPRKDPKADLSAPPTWRLLETKDLGHALLKTGMQDKATAGKFVLVAYQVKAGRLSASHVTYAPALVDSQNREFKPISNSVLYLPEGQRFMTVTRTSSDVTETFHTIYEAAADSEGFRIREERPAGDSGQKPVP